MFTSLNFFYFLLLLLFLFSFLFFLFLLFFSFFVNEDDGWYCGDSVDATLNSSGKSSSVFQQHRQETLSSQWFHSSLHTGLHINPTDSYWCATKTTFADIQVAVAATADLCYRLSAHCDHVVAPLLRSNYSQLSSSTFSPTADHFNSNLSGFQNLSNLGERGMGFRFFPDGSGHNAGVGILDGGYNELFTIQADRCRVVVSLAYSLS